MASDFKEQAREVDKLSDEGHLLVTLCRDQNVMPLVTQLCSRFRATEIPLHVSLLHLQVFLLCFDSACIC